MQRSEGVRNMVLWYRVCVQCNIDKNDATGLTVTISSGRRQFSYGCLSRTVLSVGQKISQGEVIGFAGQSLAEPYPHLHIGFQLDGEYQDPEKIFD